MDTELQEIYDKWWDGGGNERRSLSLRIAALFKTLIESGVLDEKEYLKNWRSLLENDLAQISKNLKQKPNSKESKANFHFGIFTFLKRLIFGRFLNNVVTNKNSERGGLNGESNFSVFK